jgi:hypothetical protein
MASRQILCEPKCIKVAREAALDPEAVAEGETARIVSGYAMKEFRCDLCNALIAVGDACHAVTFMTAEQAGHPEWEHDFVQPAPSPS